MLLPCQLVSIRRLCLLNIRADTCGLRFVTHTTGMMHVTRTEYTTECVGISGIREKRGIGERKGIGRLSVATDTAEGGWGEGEEE